ncbi:MAG: hypothetical protein JSU68_13690 [Phycisphaerales bacterium]|nr:MAG: hypothetical protein JSU68_13690 [Phycisphaerales bacterium]
MSYVRRGLLLIAVLVAALVVGTFVHEVIGHGLTAVALGGQVTRVVILGVEFYPSLDFVGWPIVSGYGRIDTDGVAAGPRTHLVDLAGSMSTWFVAVLANLLLWTRRRWYGWPKAVVIMLSIFWIDLFTYTLPSWGMRRSVLWGPRDVSEPYDAAVALGINGDTFRAFVIITCCAMLLSLVLHWYRGRRYCAESTTGKPDE